MDSHSLRWDLRQRLSADTAFVNKGMQVSVEMHTMTSWKRLPGRRGSVTGAVLFLTACVLGGCLPGMPTLPGTGGFTTEVVETDQAMSPKTAAMLRIAEATKANGSSGDAVTLYQNVVQEHPELPKARTSLAQALLDKGDAALALRNFRDAKKLDPENAANPLGAGQALLALHRPGDAMKEFRLALQKDPANVNAMIGLGVAFDSLEQHPDAQKYYQKALAIEPQNGAARNNYGLSLALTGLHDEAIAELLPLTKEDGEVGRKARQNLSMSYAMRGDFVNASRWAQMDQRTDDIRNDLKVYGSVRN
jgi:Flp pilus assembly protein TadD